MNYSFRPAARTNAKPLIGLYAESGCGKTKSALLLACGFVGGDMSKVAMIETESGRGEAYAGDSRLGGYQVLSLRDDFSPANYGGAIRAAEKAGFKALIIDSASHEWEGTNGVLSMAADNEAKGWKGQIVWTAPKMAHAREFMLRLMQTPIPLVIVCMRAKYPLVEYIDERKKKNMKRAEVPSPKQSEDILYEMFVHGWIDQQHAFHGTKYTLDELRNVMIDGQPITEQSGKLLSAWASGSKSAPPPASPPPPSLNGEDSPAVGADPSTGARQESNLPDGEDAPMVNAAGAPHQRDYRAEIKDALGFASKSLTARFELKLKGRKVDDLSESAAKTALEFLTQEMDKESA